MKDTRVWGIHMGAQIGSGPIDRGYVAIGWERLGDLRQLPTEREAIKVELGAHYPEAKPGAIRAWAGIIYRYLVELKAGDYVVYPSKSDRMINIGTVTEARYYDANQAYPNFVSVEWLAQRPRDSFSQAALYECGSALTLFRIKNHDDEFLRTVRAETARADQTELEDDESLTIEASAKAQETTEDFIIRRLRKLSGHEFEHFVAHLLTCMGYHTRVTQAAGDGGVDIVAHRDELGFEPPIIKVQCKRTTESVGDPIINQLLGTLGEGEFGLLVCLGSYTAQAKATDRNKAKLRLVSGAQLVQLILEHYEELTPHYRAMLPLKRIYVTDVQG